MWKEVCQSKIRCCERGRCSVTLVEKSRYIRVFIRYNPRFKVFEFDHFKSEEMKELSINTVFLYLSDTASASYDNAF